MPSPFPPSSFLVLLPQPFSPLGSGSPSFGLSPADHFYYFCNLLNKLSLIFWVLGSEFFLCWTQEPRSTFTSRTKTQFCCQHPTCWWWGGWHQVLLTELWGRTRPWFSNLSTWVLTRKEFKAKTQTIRDFFIQKVTVGEVSGRRNGLRRQVTEAKVESLELRRGEGKGNLPEGKERGKGKAGMLPEGSMHWVLCPKGF